MSTPTLPQVLLKTTLGDIILEIDTINTPKTAENFYQYVHDKFYDGLTFHRVIKGFMIQGGGFTEDMSRAPKIARAPVEHEGPASAKNAKYTIAMARTSDPHSATSQFFINTVDNDFLNYVGPTASGYGYVAFGKVISGQEIVDQIENVKVGNRGFHQNVPTTPVTIISITPHSPEGSD